MKKASLLIMVASVISKLLGFAREAILVAVLGVGAVSDAFVYSFSLPTQVFSMILAAFSTGLIPMFTRIENEEGTNSATSFLNNTINVMLVIGVIFVSILFFFTESSISILLPIADAEVLVYLVPFVKVTSFTILFAVIIQLLTGFLHVRQSFLIPALMGFPLNIVIILVIYLTQAFNIAILPYGIVLAYISQAVLILGYAYSKGFRYKPIFNLKDPHMRRMLVLALPLIIGAAAGTLGSLVNNALASSTRGGLTLINHATRIGGMVEGIFGLAIITVMYPSLSKAISLKQYEKAKREYGEAFISEMLFIVPSAFGIMLLANPIVRFVCLRGEFTEADAVALTPILFAYAFGIIAISLHNLNVRVFYSYQDTRTPMILSLTIIAIQIVLGLVLTQFIGLPGITLAMTIAFTAGVLVEFFFLKKLFKTFPFKKFGKQFVKVLIANGVMVLVVLLCRFILQPRLSNTMFLLITILVAIGVYLMAVLVLHIETFDDLIDGLRRRIKGY